MAETPPTDRPPSSAEQEHPLVAAARAGFGPLSGRAGGVWHGDSTPCVSCARLNSRSAEVCIHCGQDLSQDMLQRMGKHSGPWFVYDNLRPFPGVSLERIIRQIKRGVLGRTAIVRGPTTFYQWRYATESPLLARLLGHCWNCQSAVTEQERYCPQCKVTLEGHYRPDQLGGGGNGLEATDGGPSSDQLRELSLAISQSHLDSNISRLPRPRGDSLGRVALIALAAGLIVVMSIVAVVSLRRTSGKPESADHPSAEPQPRLLPSEDAAPPPQGP